MTTRLAVLTWLYFVAAGAAAGVATAFLRNHLGPVVVGAALSTGAVLAVIYALGLCGVPIDRWLNEVDL